MRVSSIAGTVTVVDDSDVEHDIPFDVDVPEAFSVAVTADSGSIMPNATVNLTATPTGDTDPVTYTWVKPDGTRADGATLAYAPSFAGAEVVAVLAVDADSRRAWDQIDLGPLENVTMPDPPAAPSAPSATAELVEGGVAVTLHWTDESEPKDWWEIQESLPTNALASDSFSTIANETASSSAATHATVDVGVGTKSFNTRYHYRARAVAAEGAVSGAWSDVINIVTLKADGSPGDAA